MKPKKTKPAKFRSKVLFTKARPHKDKSKYDRKPKHRKVIGA